MKTARSQPAIRMFQMIERMGEVKSNVSRLFLAAGLVAGLWGVTQAKERILLTKYTGNWDGRATTIYIANRDGSGAHQLLTAPMYEYSASVSRDNRWVVFTSERSGPANIYRVHPDGTGMERLTNNPGMDDQAALSPDGQRLAFVSTRAHGTTDIWMLDLRTHALRNLTHADSGNFRPSWSPDGNWIAFSSDRGTVPPSRGGTGARFEEVQGLAVYLMRADGSQVRRLTSPEIVAGSPKWSADGKRLVFYQTTANDAFDMRAARDFRLSGKYDPVDVASQIVSIEVASGKATALTDGPEYKLSPGYVGDEVAYVTRSAANMGVRFTKNGRGASGEFRNPNWSADGTEMVYERLIAGPLRQNQTIYSKFPDEFEFLWSHTFPAVSHTGKVAVSYDFGRSSPVAVLDADGKLSHVISDPSNTGAALYPSWSPDEQWIAYGQGGFFGGDKRPAQVYLVRPDGTDRHAVTNEPGNAGFPSFAPDGHHLAYRFRNGDVEGLRILDLDTGQSRVLTTGPDNIPVWSPTGELIAFTRAVDGKYDIFTIKPDGSDVRRLTDAPGHNAHCSWSPDGKHLIFASARYGFKDESALYYDWSTQPYTDLFVMNADGSDQRALTDNKWEDGTAAWLP